MKKLISTVLAGSMMLAVVTPVMAGDSHHGGSYGGHGGRYYGGQGGYYGGHSSYYYGHSSHHSDWSTVGQIMTGVVIGGALASAFYSEPPRQEIVYRQTVYQPAPVYVQQPIVYAPPAQPVVYAPPAQPVVYAPPAQPVVYAPPAQPAPVQYVQPQPAQDVQPQPVKQTASVTIWVQNSNGSQTPVVLRKAVNGQYIGPKGEYYTGLPSNDQLRQLYGM